MEQIVVISVTNCIQNFTQHSLIMLSLCVDKMIGHYR